MFDIQQIHITAGEDVAFCIATMKCSDNSDGAGFAPLDFRLTIGLKKIEHELNTNSLCEENRVANQSIALNEKNNVDIPGANQI